MCKRIFKEETTSNPNNGIPFYKIGTFGRLADAYISKEIYEEYKSKYSFPKIGDILISASGTIGRLVIYDGSPAYFQDSNIIWLDHSEDIVLNCFLFYCYSNLKWQTSDGGVISRLYNSDFKRIKIKYPDNKQEQQKIAACLSSLDEVITAESQKLELLKEYKKGLLQNLFPRLDYDSHGLNDGQDTQNLSNQENHKNQGSDYLPKLRFPEFVNSGKWKYCNGNELFESIVNKNHNSDLPILAVTQEQGAIPRDMIDYHISVTEKSIESYKVVEIGDFIISLRSFQGGIEYSNYKGLCSPAYIILRKKFEIENDFYRHYFKSFPFIRDLNKNLEGIRD